MAASHQWYGQSAGALIARLWTSQTMGVMLMQPSFVPNIDSQQKYADVSASELPSALGYAAGGATIPGRSSSAYDPSADTYNLTASSVLWPGATFTTAFGIIYQQDGPDKWLWSLLNFGGSVTATGSFQISFPGTTPLGVHVDPAV